MISLKSKLRILTWKIAWIYLSGHPKRPLRKRKGKHLSSFPPMINSLKTVVDAAIQLHHHRLVSPRIRIVSRTRNHAVTTNIRLTRQSRCRKVCPKISLPAVPRSLTVESQSQAIAILELLVPLKGIQVFDSSPSRHLSVKMMISANKKVTIAMVSSRVQPKV